jgi:CheY-like chemotaxis protein
MPRILVVEDEAHVRTLACRVLSGAGYDVEAVHDPEEAVRMCYSAGFDLVLSDIVMPGIDGHELARRIAPLCPRTRVVLMSGFDPGCDDCPYASRCELIPKPFDYRDLVRFVADALSRPPPRVKERSH